MSQQTTPYELREIADVAGEQAFPGILQRVLFDQPGMLVKTFSMGSEPFSTEAHRHPEVQLMLVTSGEFHIEIAGEPVHLHAGQVLKIAGDTPHRSWSDGTPATGIDIFYLPRDA
jgi:mannose-6-phosphate isomerase-like protein (cupin superfamily)